MRWLAFVLVLGCTPTQAPAPEVAPPPACEASQRLDPVIMTLQTRNHEVIVHAGERGLSFTVALGDRVLYEQLDEHEFAASFPDLHQHFETAFADERGAWAGL